MANYEVLWRIEGSEFIEDADSEEEAEDRAREHLYEYAGSWGRYGAEIVEVVKEVDEQ